MYLSILCIIHTRVRFFMIHSFPGLDLGGKGEVGGGRRRLILSNRLEMSFFCFFLFLVRVRIENPAMLGFPPVVIGFPPTVIGLPPVINHRPLTTRGLQSLISRGDGTNNLRQNVRKFYVGKYELLNSTDYW